MRVKFALLVLFMGGLTLLLGPTEGWSQFRTRGQGGGRGQQGGRGGRSFDPGQWFDRIANGKSTITIADMQRGREEAQAWAVKNNVTNGQLTREQFSSYMQERMQSRGGNRRQTGGASATTPPGRGAGRFGGRDMAAIRFQRADKNGDGFLDYSEMSESLRAELDKWDVNKDKLIDLAEYREYIKAWDAKRAAENAGRTWNGNGTGNTLEVSTQPVKPKFDLDKKVTVYRAGKLPANLPKWFKKCDLDGDAQIALYEWKEKGGTVEQFKKWDRNGDGFLTYEEVLKGNMLVLKEDPLTGKAPRGGAGGGSDWASRFFDRLAAGKPTIVIADVASDTLRVKMLEWAQKTGITNGQLTREQYTAYSAEQSQGRGFGGRGGFGNRAGRRRNRGG